MKLTDELKDARRKIETAMYEESVHCEVRCAGAGKRYGKDPSIERLPLSLRAPKMRS